MQKITVLCVGKLKEKFYQEAAAEYAKRLGRHCKLEIIELPESRLPEDPSAAEIQRALAAEAAAIRERLPRGGAVIALCIEGKPCSSVELSRRMQELVQKLKAHGYCVYYLSNIPEDVLDLLMNRDMKGLFDGGVASCEVHINKPDPRIYKALLEKYHLKAQESVFIDDRLDNVQAAFRLGFAGIQMKESVGTLVRSLATCGVALR